MWSILNDNLTAFDSTFFEEIQHEYTMADEADEHRLQNCIRAARKYIEQYCGKSFSERELIGECDSFGDFESFPTSPLNQVVSVQYIDEFGEEQTLGNNYLEVREGRASFGIFPTSAKPWPAIQAGAKIVVSTVVGTEVTPPDVKNAISALVALWYDDWDLAESAELSDLPADIAMLLDGHRVLSE